MQPEIKLAIDRLLSHQALDSDTVQSAIGAIMDGRCGEVETSAFLTALAMKGETEEELSGAANAMRARSTKIPSSHPDLLDTCGTGGDRMHTFNISTAAAIVTAAANVPVAKHGNRSVSSSSGSADVLEALGVNIDIPAHLAGQCLDEIGLCFCFARTFHLAMKHVAPIRQQLGFRTIFNQLGPLTNPAGARYQLIGVSNNEIAAKIAGAVSRLDMKRAIVVCGNNELDEVSLWGTTHIWDIQGNQIQEYEWSASDFKLPECRPDQLRVTSRDESAAVIRSVLEGKSGPAHDMVAANSAMALYCRGVVKTPQEGVELANKVIADGLALKMLQRLVEWTNKHQHA